MAGGWIQRSPCMAPAETPGGFLRIAQRDLTAAKARLLFQMLRDHNAHIDPFIASPGTCSALICSITWPR
jgi:hypothetical protein